MLDGTRMHSPTHGEHGDTKDESQFIIEMKAVTQDKVSVPHVGRGCVCVKGWCALGEPCV